MKNWNGTWIKVLVVASSLAGCAQEGLQNQRKGSTNNSSKKVPDSSNVQNVKKVTTDNTPDHSAQLTATVPEMALSNESITVTWNAVADATGYSVKVSTDAKCATSLKASGKITATNWKVDNLAPGQYYFCFGIFYADSGDVAVDDEPATKQVAIAAYKSVDELVAAKTLSQTGLFSDISKKTISIANRDFEPAYALWTDGAVKRRWIFLPSGGQIDSTDADQWKFPVGTVMWKEFSRDGKLVETRMNVKKTADMGIAGWYQVSFKWRADGSDADLANPLGETAVNGTAHDIPSQTACKSCHGGVVDVALGFSGLQLNVDAKENAAGKAFVTLKNLISQKRLKVVPEVLPEIQGDAKDKAVLGYFHANCGHCHNPKGMIFDPTKQLNFRHEGTPTSREMEPAFKSIYNRLGYVVGMKPDSSEIVRRMELLTGGRMPRLGSKDVDQTAVKNLRAWISTLAPPPDMPVSGDLKRVSEKYCTGCHAAPAMVMVSWWKDRAADAVSRLSAATTDDRYMPRNRAPITDAERAALIAAIKAL